MFWKKSQVTFNCKIPEVLANYPIIAAKDYRPNWWRQSAREYKNRVEQIGSHEHVAGTVKCPGVSSIMQRGWILTSWFDLTILTGTESDRFEYAIPPNLQQYLKSQNYDQKLINWFSENEPAIRVPLRPNSLQTLIKINTPWSVCIPKGRALITMPVPYPDSRDFTVQIGQLGPGKFYDISPTIEIHKKPGELFIPAGTPLMQMLIVNDLDYGIKQQQQDKISAELEQKTRFRTTHTFTTRDHNDN